MRIAALFLILLASVSLYAVEEEMVFGADDRWDAVSITRNTRTVEGYRGTQDIVLSNDGVEAGEETELFLPFDELPVDDRAGSYRIGPGGGVSISDESRFGEGSALFPGDEGGLELLPGETRLFAPGSMVGDFSIDFWFYPNVIDSGQQLMRWESSLWRDDRPVPQRIEAEISGQSVSWRLSNLFLTPEGETRSVEVTGARPIVPRRWSHHQFSYEASTGLLLYTVDGIPEGVAYATTTGREPGALLYGQIGRYGGGAIVIGEGLNGLLDEFRLSRTTTPPVRRRSLTGSPGEVISRPLDLGLRGSRLTSVEAVTDTPGGTEVQLFYRIGDELSTAQPEGAIDEDWRIVPSSGEISNARGRFLQLRALLLSGGDREVSPRLSEIRVSYEPVAPPPPPARVEAVARNGAVELSWSPVRLQGVTGYRIYYGTAPGNYFGGTAVSGDSPVDVGSDTSYRIEGLENGVLYFFALESYDRFGNRSAGELSGEVSARPMEWREDDP
ncbi:MAG: LamG-like jellyroll fold domain-containing protein [Alkalispirochaetaceae bacterium]